MRGGREGERREGGSNLHVNFYLVSRWLLMTCLNVAP